MIDLDALANRTISPRHQECGVGFALRTMDPDLAAKFARALLNENVRHSELEAAFGEHHYPVAQFAIGRHRRGACKCLRHYESGMDGGSCAACGEAWPCPDAEA